MTGLHDFYRGSKTQSHILCKGRKGENFSLMIKGKQNHKIINTVYKRKDYKAKSISTKIDTERNVEMREVDEIL